MKKFLFIIILLLLQSFPSLGSVNGKTLICKCNWKNCENSRLSKIYWIFHFEEKIVKKNRFSFKNDKVKLVSTDFNYELSPTLITFKFRSTRFYELDRETLMLKIKITSDYGIYKCEVFDTEKVKQKMEDIMTILQTKYDKLTTKNKI
jgi:hypothetical protein